MSTKPKNLNEYLTLLKLLFSRHKSEQLPDLYPFQNPIYIGDHYKDIVVAETAYMSTLFAESRILRDGVEATLKKQGFAWKIEPLGKCNGHLVRIDYQGKFMLAFMPQD